MVQEEGCCGEEEGNGAFLGNCEACQHWDCVGSIQKHLLLGLELVSQVVGLLHLSGGDEEKQAM